MQRILISISVFLEPAEVICAVLSRTAGVVLCSALVTKEKERIYLVADVETSLPEEELVDTLRHIRGVPWNGFNLAYVTEQLFP